ncbi:MAG: hypothetical protein ACR2RE_21090, partial [Geminicoccaceae bacterium]
AAVIGFTHKAKDKVTDWQDSYRRARTYLRAAGHDPDKLLPKNLKIVDVQHRTSTSFSDPTFRVAEDVGTKA